MYTFKIFSNIYIYMCVYIYVSFQHHPTLSDYIPKEIYF